MRLKYFGDEQVFELVWNNASSDGIWEGNAETLATEFNVTEDEAYGVLSELCDRGLIEKLYADKFAIVRWRERDDTTQEELCC
jgi:hypothetical protein